MKRLLAGLVVVGILAGHVEARALAYQPQEQASSASTSDSRGSNVVPIAAIVGAVVATSYVLFRVHKVKQARAARFNVFQIVKGDK